MNQSMNKEKLEYSRRLFFRALGIDIAATTLVVAGDFWGIGIIKDVSAGVIAIDQATVGRMEFWDAFSKILILTMLGVGLGIVKWLNSCYRFAEDVIGASGFKNKGWTATGWIIPFFNLFKPYQIINEIYKAGSPNYSIPDGWKKEGGSGLLMIWWIFWSVAHLVGVILGKQLLGVSVRDDMSVEQSIGLIEFHAGFCIMYLVISVLWLFVAGSMTRRLLDRRPVFVNPTPHIRHQATIIPEQTSPHARSPKQTLTQFQPATTTPLAGFDEANAYTLISREIETNGMDKGLWLKAMVQSGGDEKKQTMIFTVLRLAQMRDAFTADQVAHDAWVTQVDPVAAGEEVFRAPERQAIPEPDESVEVHGENQQQFTRDFRFTSATTLVLMAITLGALVALAFSGR